MLLNPIRLTIPGASTTVEIILYYLTHLVKDYGLSIYNSRNYSILLNEYASNPTLISTTVEIILYYLTNGSVRECRLSTTVEIILYYLTKGNSSSSQESTTVEIILYYLTINLP